MKTFEFCVQVSWCKHLLGSSDALRSSDPNRWGLRFASAWIKTTYICNCAINIHVTNSFLISLYVYKRVYVLKRIFLNRKELLSHVSMKWSCVPPQHGARSNHTLYIPNALSWVHLQWYPRTLYTHCCGDKSAKFTSCWDFHG